MLEDFLTVPAFADKFGLNRTTVYIAIQKNRVNAVKVLGKLCIPKSELKRFKKRTNGEQTKVLRKVRISNAKTRNGSK